MADEPTPLVSCTLHCFICGAVAERLTLRARPSYDGRGTVHSIHREVFSPIAQSRVIAEDVAEAKKAIEAANLRALMSVNPNWVSSFCPECGCCYCQEHWSQRPVSDDEGFYEYTEGTCPVGHETTMDD